MTTYEDVFRLNENTHKYPVYLYLDFADTQTITVNPLIAATFKFFGIAVTDMKTGTQYLWSASTGTWGATGAPYITPGTNMLQIGAIVSNVGNQSGTATVTATPSSGNPQSVTNTIAGSATAIPMPPITLTMPSSPMTITIAVSP